MSISTDDAVEIIERLRAVGANITLRQAIEIVAEQCEFSKDVPVEKWESTEVE